MLESYVQKWLTPSLENFRYMLRSGMMGWLTVMLDTTAWDEQQHAAAKQEIRLYKEKLRPFIRDADLYHISERPNGVDWDGIEYFDPKRGESVVYVFRGSTETKDKHVFRLQGLKPSQQYRLHFNDGSAADRTMSGQDLAGTGLAVTLAVPNSSELIFIGRQIH
jgi:alpha-galactosidase